MNIMPVTGRNYVLTTRHRADQPCIELQKNVTINGDVACQTMKVKVNAVETRLDEAGREYAYFNYEPIRDDSNMCVFGWDKIYADSATQPKFASTLAPLN